MPACFPRRFPPLGLLATALIVVIGLFTACANSAPPPAATPIPTPTATPPPVSDPEFAVTPVGLVLNEPESSPGYTLFGLRWGNRKYLIDKAGKVVHAWDLAGGVAWGKLAANGDLLVAWTRPDRGVRIIAPDGTVKWEYRFRPLHHDFLQLPNGNVLMLAKEWKTYQEAIAAGINPDCVDERGLDVDYLVEVQPTGPAKGEVVWRWSAWDHLIQDFDPGKANYGVVAEHPELIDVNFRQCEKLGRNVRNPIDWIHANSVDYHPEREQILISARNLGEVWIIDHSATTEEAASRAGGRAGQGGGLLYRWGNPQAYRAGTPSDQQLFWAHDAQWIEPGLPGAGNILIFNNGDEDAAIRRYYSSIEEFTPPYDGLNYRREPGSAYGPAEPLWRYIAEPPGSFYSPQQSGVQRLPNGNTLICSSFTGALFEVTPGGETVWQYINPLVAKANAPLRQGDPMPLRNIVHGVHQWDNHIYRATRYTPDYPGLRGLDLTPGDPIELYE